MLRGIDEIDWGACVDAYGPAKDTPGHLHGLASSSPEARASAYDFFYTNVLHQASIYEVAIHVVPFVVELIRDSKTPERSRLLELLSDFYGGGSWHEIHETVTLLAERSATTEYQNEKAAEQKAIVEIRRRIGSGLEHYVACFQDSEAEVRLRAISLVAWFSDRGVALRAPLLRVSKEDSVPAVRANAVSAMGILGIAEKEEFEAYQDDSEVVRVVVALQRHLRWSDPPEASSRLLLDAVGNPEVLSALDKVPLLGDALGAVGVAFAACPRQIRDEALVKACEGFERAQQSSSWLSDESAIGLLRLAFDRPFTTNTELTELQLRAVSAVARQAWGALGAHESPASGYLNMIDVLRAFGLPDREDVMRELLGRTAAKPHVLSAVKTTRRWWKFWG